jgi:hypothetical protein
MLDITTKSTVMLLAAVLMAAFTVATEKATVPTPKHEVLRGRVIADVASTAFGAGLGPNWLSFVFAVETSKGGVYPVRIAYAFYKTEQIPPDSFWDYSALYDLTVHRDPECDTTVRAISYEKNVDEHANELPSTFVLQYAKNYPSPPLKPATALPCYMLWYGQYKRVDTFAAR